MLVEPSTAPGWSSWCRWCGSRAARTSCTGSAPTPSWRRCSRCTTCTRSISRRASGTPWTPRGAASGATGRGWRSTTWSSTPARSTSASAAAAGAARRCRDVVRRALGEIAPEASATSCPGRARGPGPVADRGAAPELAAGVVERGGRCGRRRAAAVPGRAAGGGRRRALRPVRRGDPRRARPPGPPRERALRCACRPCSLLFSEERAGVDGAFVAGYRTVPDRYRRDPDFTLTDAGLGRPADPGLDGVLPPRLHARRRPSPATRARQAPPRASSASSRSTRASARRGSPRCCSPTSRPCWCGDPATARRISRVQLRPRVSECFLVPIDACYRLVGLVRTTWKGFDGGAAAWAAIDGFFDDVRGRARDLRPSDGGPAR